MASAETVRVDYEALAQVAARFQQRSQSTVQMAGQVRQSYARLQDDSWIGRGAEAFFREMDGEILPAVRRLIEALAEAANVTNAIVQNFQQSDQQAANPFLHGSDQDGASIGPDDQVGGGSAGGGLGGDDLSSDEIGAGNSGETVSIPAGEIPFSSSGDQLFPGLTPEIENSFMVPEDWLSGVEGSLNDFIQQQPNDLSIPQDWLDNVQVTPDDLNQVGGEPTMEEAQVNQDDGGGSGGGSGGGESGGGSGGGEGNAAEAMQEQGEEQAEGGGSSGGGASGGGMGGGTPSGESAMSAGSPFDSGSGLGGVGGGFSGDQSGAGFVDRGEGMRADTTSSGDGAAVQMRYVGMAGGGVAAGEDQGGYSQITFAPGAEAAAAESGESGGLASLAASVLASSPFLAALAGKLGKKQDDTKE